MGYEISDAIGLKDLNAEVIGILKGTDKPCFAAVNNDAKVIVTENG